MTDDDRIRAALIEVDGIARDACRHEYGLPLYGEEYGRMAAAVRAALPPPLTWTTTPPDRPGWYWLRRSRTADERVREVCEADRDGRRVLLVVEKNGAFPIPGHYDGYSFAGPIPEPTEPTA